MFVHELISQGNSQSIVFQGSHPVSYRQLQDEVNQYRKYFYAQGITAGENVGLILRNSVEYIYSYMAVISLGAVIVPLNFQLSTREIAYIVKDAKMKFLITMEEVDITGHLQQMDYHEAVEQLIIPRFKPVLSRNVFSEVPDLTGHTEDEPCVIIYTSGTTGVPKGAMLSHINLISNAVAFHQVLNVTPADNVLCVLPMYHCFAWTCAVLNTLLCGASMTILDGFSPKETLAAIRDNTVTVVYGVPPMYNILARVGEPADLGSVRIFVSGGAALPEKVAERFVQKYDKHILEGYGLSEASPVVSLNPPGQTKPGSIGRALPGLIVTVFDENDHEVPAGQVGELVVKGPSVMKGYFNLPEETAQVLRGSWLHTGDLAYKDQDDYFFIVDRLKDMIITNGENIYPREIEELLYAYPGIMEAAVIGMEDKLRGQQAVAYLVLTEGDQLDKKKLRDYLVENLAAYKVPREFILVDALPKNTTGKILKRALREQQFPIHSAWED